MGAFKIKPAPAGGRRAILSAREQLVACRAENMRLRSELFKLTRAIKALTTYVDNIKYDKE